MAGAIWFTLIKTELISIIIIIINIIIIIIIIIMYFAILNLSNENFKFIMTFQCVLNHFKYCQCEHQKHV